MTVAEPQSPFAYLERVSKDGSLDAAVERQRLGSALGRAVQALGVHSDRLKLASELAAIAPLVHDDLDPAQREALPGQVRQLFAIGKALEEAADEAALAEVPARLADAKAPIDVLKAALQSAWLRRIDREFQPLRALAAVPGLADAAHRVSLAQAAQAGLGMRRNFPPDGAQRDAFAAALARRDELVADLERVGVTPAIQGFLLKAMAEEATLADLTPEVLTWIDARGARGSFSVGLAPED